MAVKRYDGSAWQVVAGKGDQGTSSSIATWVKTASGGETSLSGNDDNSQPLSYTVGQELVFINGALQKRGVDYTATTGTSITGLTALVANDVVTVWTVNAFSVTGAIANTIVDNKGDILVGTGADTPGILSVGSNDQVLTADSSTGTGLKWAAASNTACGATAFTSSTQNTTQNVYTIINLNSEAFDTDGLHSTATNTSRLTIPTGKGGYWLINALTVIDASGNDVFLQVFKNGSAITGYGQWDNRFAASNYGGAGYVVASGSQAYPLSGGDYVEVAVKTAKATGANCLYMTFSAMYLGA